MRQVTPGARASARIASPYSSRAAIETRASRSASATSAGSPLTATIRATPSRSRSRAISDTGFMPTACCPPVIAIEPL